jgi:hypothetical protein
MTEAELIELADRNGLGLGMIPPVQLTESEDGQTLHWRRRPGLTVYGQKLLQFGAAVVAAERERCAKIADEQADKWMDDSAIGACRNVSAAIREAVPLPQKT